MYACKIKETANGSRRSARSKTSQEVEVLAQRRISPNGEINEQKRATKNGENKAQRKADTKTKEAVEHIVIRGLAKNF
jgi:hypothetical protein